MVIFLFELSGDNLRLAIQELSALFETENTNFKILKTFSNFILVESKLDERNVSGLMNR